MQPITRGKKWINTQKLKLFCWLTIQDTWHKLFLWIAEIFLKFNYSDFFGALYLSKYYYTIQRNKSVCSLILSKIDLTLTLLLWETSFLNHTVLFIKHLIYRFFYFCKWKQGQLLFSITYSIMSMHKTGELKENSLYRIHYTPHFSSALYISFSIY